MYFRHLLFHIEHQHCEQSILTITLEWIFLNCSILTRDTLPLSSSTPLFIYLSPPPPLFFPLSSLPYISLLLHPSLPFFLSLFLLPSPFLPSSISYIYIYICLRFLWRIYQVNGVKTCKTKIFTVKL